MNMNKSRFGTSKSVSVETGKKSYLSLNKNHLSRELMKSLRMSKHSKSANELGIRNTKDYNFTNKIYSGRKLK